MYVKVEASNTTVNTTANVTKCNSKRDGQRERDDKQRTTRALAEICGDVRSELRERWKTRDAYTETKEFASEHFSVQIVV